ncbi:MAG: hypothetical protein K5881_10285 [Saccharofermentans sp.]|nr:hypothetical protein [Saccharofermentans sp.]
MKGKRNKNNDNKARKPELNGELINSEVLESGEGTPSEDFMEGPVEAPKKSVTLNDLAEIDPELLTGKSQELSAAPVIPALPEAKDSRAEDFTSEEIPTEINLDKNESAFDDPNFKRNAGFAFVILGVVIVAVIAVMTLFLDSGMDKSFISPLTIKDRDISSAEFSFMYHYELLSEGVDLFAADAEEKLSSPYLDDENFANYREYFRFVTAQDLQKMEILYDDATSQGYQIEKPHYDRANAYINWLKGKADELGVPLDTYIKGVFGSQVDEQCIINTLAKKYFTEDYANGEKLVQLSASDEQAEEAYNQSRNIYDLVSYKILRMTFEQRDKSFIDTANLRCQKIIDAMDRDPSKFESCAAPYFSGIEKKTLEQQDSTLVPNCRYEDISHDDFRDWLFDETRKDGDSVILHDEDGFPIILVFVSRVRMSEQLRNCYIIAANVQTGEGDDIKPDIAATQALSQEIYDSIDDADSCNEVENLYNDYILAGQLSVLHDSQIYKAKYQSALAEWIFAEDRQLGDKTLIEIDGTFYVIYFISESPNPEWYDMVNSFLSMNNLQQFIQSKAGEYIWKFNNDGLAQIKDVP